MQVFANYWDKLPPKWKEFLRFCIVGVTATAIHYGIYLALIHLLPGKNGWWTNAAYSLGYLAGFVFNFILSARFTFKEEMTVKNGIGFSVTNLINYGLHILFLNLVLWLGISEKWAPIPVYCIVVPINFLLVRFVFKKIK